MAPIFTGSKFGFGRSSDGPIPFSATGGTVTTSGLYTIHTFSYPNSQNFVVTGSSKSVEYLVVAGGGAGGGGGIVGGGGGGGGGLISNHPDMPAPLKAVPLTVTEGAYTVTVGQGGQGAPGASLPVGNPGGSSFFGPIVCQGGGGGGRAPTYTGESGSPGGSGGGGGANYGGSGNGAGGTGNRVTGTSTPAPTQGNPGSPAPGEPAGSGGGGGGGGAGGAASGMPGGLGLSISISGSSVTYSAGGRGQDGAADGGSPAILTNYGSGGNAKYGGGSPADGGTGANGIVIIRYLT
jgi:hypothetical protein